MWVWVCMGCVCVLKGHLGRTVKKEGGGCSILKLNLGLIDLVPFYPFG